MQPPSFWRDLEAKFQGLPDSVWANRDAPDRLHMSDGKVRGGDASLRSRFKNVAGLGGMALCADRGFGADVFDGVWMWEDAVTAYLKEEKTLGTRSVGLRAGSLVQPRNKSWLFPRFVHDTMSRTTPWTRLFYSTNGSSAFNGRA